MDNNLLIKYQDQELTALQDICWDDQLKFMREIILDYKINKERVNKGYR